MLESLTEFTRIFLYIRFWNVFKSSLGALLWKEDQNQVGLGSGQRAPEAVQGSEAGWSHLVRLRHGLIMGEGGRQSAYGKIFEGLKF